MTDTQHTPGPWETDGSSIRSADALSWIASTSDTVQTTAEHRANARFIVTACNAHYAMLEALQRLEGLVSRSKHNGYSMEGQPVAESLDYARAAIRKATGDDA